MRDAGRGALQAARPLLLYPSVLRLGETSVSVFCGGKAHGAPCARRAAVKVAPPVRAARGARRGALPYVTAGPDVPAAGGPRGGAGPRRRTSRSTEWCAEWRWWCPERCPERCPAPAEPHTLIWRASRRAAEQHADQPAGSGLFAMRPASRIARPWTPSHSIPVHPLSPFPARSTLYRMMALPGRGLWGHSSLDTLTSP